VLTTLSLDIAFLVHYFLIKRVVSSKFAKKMEHKSNVRVPPDGNIPLVAPVVVGDFMA
jgi:hypothetical protein